MTLHSVNGLNVFWREDKGPHSHRNDFDKLSDNS